MECYTCTREIPFAYRVMLRGNPEPPESDVPPFSSPKDPAYLAYVKEMTYRPAYVCPGCYHALDNQLGLADIDGRTFNIAGRSRAGKAPVYDETKRRMAKRRLAARLGLAE